jgi:hypothetical protein
VIDPSFVGIVSFRGDYQIMSVSRGGKPDFEEFNLPPVTKWAKTNQQSQQ